MLTLSFEPCRPVLVVHFTGRLDQETAESAAAELRPELAGIQELILDLGGLTYLSSYGLRLLLKLAKEMPVRGGTLKLAAIPTAIGKVMETSGLAGYFARYDSVPAARSAGREQPPHPGNVG